MVGMEHNSQRVARAHQCVRGAYVGCALGVVYKRGAMYYFFVDDLVSTCRHLHVNNLSGTLPRQWSAMSRIKVL